MHRIDWELQENLLCRAWHSRGHGWFWSWGSYGIGWGEEGMYWLWGLGLFTLCCYNSPWRGRLWSLQANID